MEAEEIYFASPSRGSLQRLPKAGSGQTVIRKIDVGRTFPLENDMCQDMEKLRDHE